MKLHPTTLRYPVAVASVLAASAAHRLLDPILSDRHDYTAYWLAALATARFAGLGPAVLCVGLGLILAEAPLAGDRHPPRVVDVLGPTLFLAVGLMIARLGGDFRAARAGLDRESEGRGRAESGLLAEAERLRITLESIADGVIVADLDGRIVTLNPVAERLLGWPSAEAAGRPLDEVFRLVDEASGDDVDDPAGRVLGEGSAVTLARDCLLVARDGTRRPVDDSVAAIKDRSGAVTGLVVIFRDDSGRRAAERAIREGEERLQLALQAASMGTWDYEIATRRVAWSTGLEAMHGLAPGTFAGTFEAFLADILPEDRDRVIRLVTRTVEDGRDHEIQYRFAHPDGRIRWVEGRGTLFRDGAGRPARLIGVCVDITDRRREEEALRDADRRKDEFLATLAHELRNPLAPIRTGLQILGHTEKDNPAVEPLRSMMQRQAEHLGRLVEDLVDVSRLNRGSLELRKEVVDLAEVVGQAVAKARPLFEERGHDLAVSLPESVQAIEADPTRLEQVLDNLLSNAAKYTNPGGRVRLDARREGDEVVLAVEDDGIGFEPGQVGQVFDLFVQVERRLDRSRGGLGIGLHLVKMLVEMHGGSVSARSDGPGLGARFEVRLPAPAGFRSVASPAGPRPGPGEGPPRRRVLVVDDNEDAANCLGRYLARVAGQQVEIAHDGPAAVELARDFRPEVVLLDIGLPGMDGYEVAQRLRRGPETAGALLIAVTGWGQDEDRRRSGASGIDVHLVKPVDLDAIRELLIDWAAPGRAGTS